MFERRSQNRIQQFLGGTLVFGALLGEFPVRSEDSNETIKRLETRIEDLDQKLKALERNRGLDNEAAEAKPKELPKISLGEKGFSFSDARGNFKLNIRGILQVDSRTVFHDGGVPSTDAILLRRIRPVIEGTIYHDFDFLFVPDFGTSASSVAVAATPVIFDAYLNYRCRSELQLRIGKFKSPVGLEQLQVDLDTLFNERALPTILTPNRDLGVQFHGTAFDGVLSYAAGVFNGVGDNRNSLNADVDDAKAFAGRVFYQPFKRSERVPALKGFGFGVGGSAGADRPEPANTSNVLGNFLTDSQQAFFAYKTGVTADGDHWRLSPQAYYYWGPFGLLGEYAISDQRIRTTVAPLVADNLHNTAWQIQASYVLTGEAASYKGGVIPLKPFNPGTGDWGALQVVGRFSELNIDENAFRGLGTGFFADRTVSANFVREWSVGLNWYLSRNLRLSTSFARSTFGFIKGGGTGVGGAATAPGIITRQPENVLFTRMQLAF